ncbi:hypothetical protein KJ742_00215 [Patescibacteria group bacterium]|nr:hypothetical protein [Patescibacteria group bacterium]MBU1682348.1 hypothetical protein [Patescibacteria group bacterium]MBU1935405.1 hypothetical protein [Patescibacteria group bacterium]
MAKKLLILVSIFVIAFVLLQIPSVDEYVQGVKDSFTEKRDNVAEEYDRVKDKVSDVVDKVEDTKEGVEDAIDTVSDAVDAVGETVDKVSNVFGDDEEEADEEETSSQTCTEEQKAAEICTMDYTPVCGDDGVTYGNACGACASGNVDTYVKGECGEEVAE